MVRGVQRLPPPRHGAHGGPGAPGVSRGIGSSCEPGMAMILGDWPEPVSQSVSQPVGQSASQSVSQSGCTPAHWQARGLLSPVQRRQRRRHVWRARQARLRAVTAETPPRGPHYLPRQHSGVPTCRPAGPFDLRRQGMVAPLSCPVVRERRLGPASGFEQNFWFFSPP